MTLMEKKLTNYAKFDGHKPVMGEAVTDQIEDILYV